MLGYPFQTQNSVHVRDGMVFGMEFARYMTGVASVVTKNHSPRGVVSHRGPKAETGQEHQYAVLSS